MFLTVLHLIVPLTALFLKPGSYFHSTCIIFWKLAMLSPFCLSFFNLSCRKLIVIFFPPLTQAECLLWPEQAGRAHFGCSVLVRFLAMFHLLIQNSIFSVFTANTRSGTLSIPFAKCLILASQRSNIRILYHRRHIVFNNMS